LAPPTNEEKQEKADRNVCPTCSLQVFHKRPQGRASSVARPDGAGEFSIDRTWGFVRLRRPPPQAATARPLRGFLHSACGISLQSRLRPKAALVNRNGKRLPWPRAMGESDWPATTEATTPFLRSSQERDLNRRYTETETSRGATRPRRSADLLETHPLGRDCMTVCR
jgi:hypothetical protein